MPPPSDWRLETRFIEYDMHNQTINLLPWDRQRAVRRDYGIRMLVVGIICTNALILSAAALLVPTYVLLAETIRTKQVKLASVESVSVATTESSISMRIDTLLAQMKALVALSKESAISDIFRNVLDVPHPDVSLSGFSFSEKNTKGDRSVSISGIAKTRDALRNYQRSLSESSFIRSANLPVSAYAKDSNIDFIINVQLAP